MAEISRRALIGAAIAAPVVAHAAPLFRPEPPRIVTFDDWFWSLRPRDTPAVSTMKRVRVEATRVLGPFNRDQANATQIMRKMIGAADRAGFACAEAEEAPPAPAFDGDLAALEEAALRLKRDMEFAVTSASGPPDFGSTTTPRKMAGMPFWGSDDPADYHLGVLWGPELIPLTDRRAMLVAEVTIYPMPSALFA